MNGMGAAQAAFNQPGNRLFIVNNEDIRHRFLPSQNRIFRS
jgi:hypothetical protein